MEILLIDTLGILLEIFVAIVFFETFWDMKKLNRYLFAFGILAAAIILIIATTFLQNTFLLPVITIAFTLALSYCFNSNITYKLLLSFVIIAIMFAAEQLIAVFFVNVARTPLAQVQSNPLSYMVGVLVSKLIALFLVYIIRIFMRNRKQHADKKFNMLMAFMPIQSIILCFIVYGYSLSADAQQSPTLGIASVVISLLLVFFMMVVLNNQHKAFAYKNEYEKSQVRLKMQIEHYHKLYQAHNEVRSIRHNVSNKLIAISGLLANSMVQEAMDRIGGIVADVEKTPDCVYTGHPSVDAVLDAKISKAHECGIDVAYKAILDGDLCVDHFDLAVIIANALDNAIEGIERSEGVNKSISLSIASASDYISIFLENSASAPMEEGFKTSKPDKPNHGFGLPQMRDIAQKYNGYIRPIYDPEMGKFTLNILLMNQHT